MSYAQEPPSSMYPEVVDMMVVMGAGDADEYSGPEESLAAHRYLPKSQLSIIPGCGHVKLFCNARTVWESMKIFLGFEEST